MNQTAYVEVELSTQKLITTSQAWQYSIIPKKSDTTSIEFYIDSNRLHEGIKEDLSVLFDKTVRLFPVDSEVIQKGLSRYYRNYDTSSLQMKGLPVTSSEGDFFARLVSEASAIHSSDIHIESYQGRARVRMRIDGKLIECYSVDKDDYPALINKIKIKANLDIAEKRLPQDGRILFTRDGKQFDIRVSIIPTLFGEKTVLRMLSKDSEGVDLADLGFTPLQLDHYLESIRKPSGILLISGPTGSGKTTTLYATLKVLNKESINILTIEDPIEYTLEGVNQVQVKESIGLTFASALRTFLRQDPDIIMLGEIRDNETAQMAIRASLTGHLVLSTIHTNSALGTITRMIDMGIPRYLVAETLNLSVSQRLIRILCPHCKKSIPFTSTSFPKNFKAEVDVPHHFTHQGCSLCHYTGYIGRKAVFEVIPIFKALSDDIKNSLNNTNRLLQQAEIKKISDSAIEILLQGQTSIDEIFPLLLANEF